MTNPDDHHHHDEFKCLSALMTDSRFHFIAPVTLSGPLHHLAFFLFFLQGNKKAWMSPWLHIYVRSEEEKCQSVQFAANTKSELRPVPVK